MPIQAVLTDLRPNESQVTITIDFSDTDSDIASTQNFTLDPNAYADFTAAQQYISTQADAFKSYVALAKILKDYVGKDILNPDQVPVTTGKVEIQADSSPPVA